MATVKDAVLLMEEIAPKNLSDIYCQKYGSYDNSGLIIGDENRQIFTVMCCLDITSEVASEAVDLNADMIISHHPLIYDGIKSILKGTPQGNIIYTLIKNDIALYCSHLSFDIAPYGVNQIMADKLCLKNCKVLKPVGEEAGLGRIGRLETPKTLSEISKELERLINGGVKVSGEPDRLIETVAVVCGSGGNGKMVEKVYEMGADLYITSEIKHHAAIAAKELNIALIEAGHYAIENISVPVLASLLSSYAEAKNIDIEVTESSVITDPFI